MGEKCEQILQPTGLQFLYCLLPTCSSRHVTERTCIHSHLLYLTILVICFKSSFSKNIITTHWYSCYGQLHTHTVATHTQPLTPTPTQKSTSIIMRAYVCESVGEWCVAVWLCGRSEKIQELDQTTRKKGIRYSFFLSFDGSQFWPPC
jgi:hypothetical protein